MTPSSLSNSIREAIIYKFETPKIFFRRFSLMSNDYKHNRDFKANSPHPLRL